jgi:hypothetical protein
LNRFGAEEQRRGSGSHRRLPERQHLASSHRTQISSRYKILLTSKLKVILLASVYLPIARTIKHRNLPTPLLTFSLTEKHRTPRHLPTAMALMYIHLSTLMQAGALCRPATNRDLMLDHCWSQWVRNSVERSHRTMILELDINFSDLHVAEFHQLLLTSVHLPSARTIKHRNLPTPLLTVSLTENHRTPNRDLMLDHCWYQWVRNSGGKSHRTMILDLDINFTDLHVAEFHQLSLSDWNLRTIIRLIPSSCTWANPIVNRTTLRSLTPNMKPLNKLMGRREETPSTRRVIFIIRILRTKNGTGAILPESDRNRNIHRVNQHSFSCRITLNSRRRFNNPKFFWRRNSRGVQTPRGAAENGHILQVQSIRMDLVYPRKRV